MKYLLLIHLTNGCESYYGNDPDKLKEYAELRNFNCFEVYELKKAVYSYVAAE